MGIAGAIIMSFFGGVFACLALYWQWNVHGMALAAPFLIFFLVLTLAAYIRRLPGQGHVLTTQVERVIMWSSAAEGIGLFVASNVVINLHRPEWQLPAMALIVGLHFFPIAFAASYRPFYLLGTSLIAAAVLGFVTAAPTGGQIAGIVAALSLWIAAFLGLIRDWQSKKRSAAAT